MLYEVITGKKSAAGPAGNTDMQLHAEGFLRTDPKQDFSVPGIIGRITSYNVCYTKLLRLFESQSKKGSRCPRVTITVRFGDIQFDIHGI